MYNAGTLVAAHDMYVAEKQKHNYLTKGEYEEYYVNAVRPYFMTDTTGEFSPRIIAADMHKNGVFTHLEYKDIISREGADISDRDSNAAKYIRQKIQEKGYDSLIYMNEKADSGSMGVIVLEPSQLTLVSIDGKPIDENISLENVEESGYNEGIKNTINSFDVKLPDGTISKLTKDTEIIDVEVFAGKGSNSELRVRYHLVNNYGGKAENWKHVKGRGFVDTLEGTKKAMLHWFEEETIGIVEMFVKGWSKK